MASQHITFDNLPASIRKPGTYAEFNYALAVHSLPGNLQKTCILAPRTAAGTLPALTLADVFDSDQAATLLGRGSIGHLMVKAALTANPYLTLSVIGLADDDASIAAANTVTITGPATGAGVVTVNMANFDAIQIAVASGDTANAIAAALKAKFDALPDLPVSAAVTAAVVTLTARNKGTLGNGHVFSTSSTAAGVTATATQPSAGQTDPDLGDALAAIFTAGHNILICPWAIQAQLTDLRTHLDTVSGPLEKRGALGVFGQVGTLSASTTLAGELNAGRITGILVAGTVSAAYEVAAAYGAVIASEEDPARPLNTLPLTGIAPPPLESRLGREEQENLLNNGITPAEVGPGEVVQIVRAISTYTENAAGAEDISLLDITTIRSLDYGRKAIVDRMTLRFPRSKKSKRVKAQIREEALDVMYGLEALEIWENVKENEDGVIVEDDLQDPNRADLRIPADVVNGLHVLGIRIDLIL